MKTTNKTFAAVIILAASLVLSSCQKEKITPKSLTNKTDVKWVDDTYNDMLKYAGGINSGSFKTDDAFSIASCATVTNDTVSNPHTRVIDYGTGCVDEDGKTHYGQVILTFNTTDFLHDPGAYVSVSFNNYFVGDDQITGSLNLLNTGINGNGNISFTLDADARRVMGDGSGNADSVVGQQIVEWVAGSSTSESVDDEFSFTGGAGGQMANGATFQMSILQPLTKKRAPGCYHYVKGQVLIQVSNESDRYLDYGDGTCDNLAVETIDGNSTTVTLD